MTLLLLLAALVSPASAGQLKSKFESAKAVVWAGIDYSAARFFVPERFDDPEERVFFEPGGGLGDDVRRYGKPDDAWKDLSKEWNVMLQNLLKEDLEKAIQRDVVVDMPTEAGQTQKKPPYWESQYEAKNVPRDLTEQKVRDMVKKYRMKTKEGVALVFIVERMSKLDKEGCVWPTVFELPKKEVVWTQQVCEKPSGSSFRNYWLRPIFSVGEDLIKQVGKDQI